MPLRHLTRLVRSHAIEASHSMKYFVVTREPGRAWNVSCSMRAQEEWAKHATFMNKLADEGFIVLGGPVGDGSKILLVVKADNEGEIKTRLAADPWASMELLQTTKIDPWEILLGNTGDSDELDS